MDVINVHGRGQVGELHLGKSVAGTLAGCSGGAVGKPHRILWQYRCGGGVASISNSLLIHIRLKSEAYIL